MSIVCMWFNKGRTTLVHNYDTLLKVSSPTQLSAAVDHLFSPYTFSFNEVKFPHYPSEIINFFIIIPFPCMLTLTGFKLYQLVKAMPVGRSYASRSKVCQSVEVMPGGRNYGSRLKFWQSVNICILKALPLTDAIEHHHIFVYILYYIFTFMKYRSIKCIQTQFSVRIRVFGYWIIYWQEKHEKDFEVTRMSPVSRTRQW